VKKEAAEAGRTWRIVLFNSNHQQWAENCWVCEARLYFAVDELVVPGYWPPTPPTTPTPTGEGDGCGNGCSCFPFKLH
jgi:hypothetical protein